MLEESIWRCEPIAGHIVHKTCKPISISISDAIGWVKITFPHGVARAMSAFTLAHFRRNPFWKTVVFEIKSGQVQGTQLRQVYRWLNRGLCDGENCKHNGRTKRTKQYTANLDSIRCGNKTKKHVQVSTSSARWLLKMLWGSYKVRSQRLYAKKRIANKKNKRNVKYNSPPI